MMKEILRIMGAVLIFTVLSPGAAQADGGIFSNGWESTDWLSVGAVLPAPGLHCEEENNQPPCYRSHGVAAVVRVEVGRFRYERFQWNIASGFVGQSWVLKEYLGFGIFGLGAHWPLTEDKVHEVGFITQPLSIFMATNAWGNLTTNLYYRYNKETIFAEFGVEFAPLWDNSPLGGGEEKSQGLEELPIHLFAAVGF